LLDHPRDAEDASRPLGFAPANRLQLGIEDPARVAPCAACQQHEADGGADVGEAADRTAAGDGFIVRVGQDGEDSLEPLKISNAGPRIQRVRTRRRPNQASVARSPRTTKAGTFGTETSRWNSRSTRAWPDNMSSRVPRQWPALAIRSLAPQK